MADSTIPPLQNNAPGTGAILLSKINIAPLATPEQGLITGVLVGEILSTIHLLTALVTGALGGGLKLALVYGAMALCSSAVILLASAGSGALTGGVLRWLTVRED